MLPQIITQWIEQRIITINYIILPQSTFLSFIHTLYLSFQITQYLYRSIQFLFQLFYTFIHTLKIYIIIYQFQFFTFLSLQIFFLIHTCNLNLKMCKRLVQISNSQFLYLQLNSQCFIFIKQSLVFSLQFELIYFLGKFKTFYFGLDLDFFLETFPLFGERLDEVKLDGKYYYLNLKCFNQDYFVRIFIYIIFKFCITQINSISKLTFNCLQLLFQFHFLFIQNSYKNMQQQPPAKNAINNYKGVMLCSRPNENKQAQLQKPFCARVVPPDPIGLLPFKKVNEIKQPKKSNPIVEKHKQWLQEFKIKQIIKKQTVEQQKQREQQRFQKVRAQGEQDRQKAKKMKQEYNSVTKNVLNILDDNGSGTGSASNTKKGELNSQNLRKLNELALQQQNNKAAFKKKKDPVQVSEKPLWAHTQKQIEKKQDQQVDQLLDFFQNTDVEQFINDTEVNSILKTLKQKIQNMKKQQNWKQKQIAKAKLKKQNQVPQQNNDDTKSQMSLRSQGAKSVASEKSSKRIQQLAQKLEKKKEGIEQWDKYSKNSKNNFTTLQEKIAKNVADEVLRSYGNFKGVHSNNSIRRLLEKQAAKQLIQPHPRPIITTVFKQKTPLDMNNLPYLHRNPAI